VGNFKACFGELGGRPMKVEAKARFIEPMLPLPIERATAARD